ncbi:gnk2-like domain-containing protein [Artemisia annua]|uniref:Gnk2-like domain-containing protein n=1 Tax=Artemisia annua TaxID=35608 RepID=A0A2U1KG18_ARTAN|nr:gnk2-like domain-containing protein [Artemisia annua]
MKPKSIVLILLTTIINFNLTVSQSSDFGIYKCKNNTSTNVFKQDITKSLTSLTGHVASHGGFYNSTASTRVTSTALCRGDIGPEECEKCVKTAIPSLLRNCPNHAEAAAWYSDCIVRFSHGEIVGVLDTWTFDKLYNSASVDKGEVSEFSEALSELTVKLTDLAANGGSVRKLGFGNVTVVGSGLVRTIYAMMQCTPDLSKEMCRKCLFNASEEIGKCCRGRVAARVFYPNCFLRYSNEHFYNDPPLISSSGEAKSGVLDTWTFDKLYNSASVDKGEVSEFSEALSELTVKLTALAANGGSVRKLGFGNVTVVGSGLVRTIYAMMQCTPDLSKEMCRKCLFNASEEIGKCCRGRVAARVFYPNCFLRYSNEHFYNDPPLISSSGEAKSGTDLYS